MGKQSERFRTWMNFKILHNKEQKDFQGFSTLQIRVASTQAPVPQDLLGIVNRAIESTQQKIPALKRSNHEIIQEHSLS